MYNISKVLNDKIIYLVVINLQNKINSNLHFLINFIYYVSINSSMDKQYNMK